MQLRIADSITAFAGSMPFVYIHVVVFACWMIFVESDPWPRLTLIVSLEAIFLSTFVMIGQNRQAEFRRAKADHDFSTEAQELQANTELTRAIHTLTTEIHRHVVGGVTEEEGPGDRRVTRSHGRHVVLDRASGRLTFPSPREAPGPRCPWPHSRLSHGSAPSREDPRDHESNLSPELGYVQVVIPSLPVRGPQVGEHRSR